MPKSTSVSLQDIAEKAGVSKATVSLALKDHPRISKKTVNQIKRIAREMGYKPNPHLSKLMASTKQGPVGDQGSLAFIRSAPSKDWNPNERLIYDKFKVEAESRGYHLEVFWLTDPASTPAKVNRVMWSRGIEGIIIPMIHPLLYHQGVRTLELDWEKFCAVELSDTLQQPTISGVRHNHFSGMLRTLAELEAAGYVRMGLTMWQDVELRTHHRWSAAYLLWKHLRGFDHDLPLFLPEVLHTPALVNWIQQNRLDLVISPGMECYRTLIKAGFAIPQDIGYATLDQWGEGSEGLTGIDQDRDGQIQVALDILIGKIHRADRGVPEKPINALTPGIWRQGKTTRPPISGRSVQFLDQERLLQP